MVRLKHANDEKSTTGGREFHTFITLSTLFYSLYYPVGVPSSIGFVAFLTKCLNKYDILSERTCSQNVKYYYTTAKKYTHITLVGLPCTGNQHSRHYNTF